MPNPSVPKRPNQIPRSLPVGVGGGDGFGHHPRPVSNGVERPENYPMKQRRYRGAGGGDYQWDSRTETPVWREIPRDKNLPKRQWSPSPREAFPATGKRSRYKPGTLRIPVREGDRPIPVEKPIKKAPSWVKGGLKGGVIDFLKDEALKPQHAGDGTLPAGAFPKAPPLPPMPEGRKVPTTCGIVPKKNNYGAGKNDTLNVMEVGVYRNEVSLMDTFLYPIINGKGKGGLGGHRSSTNFVEDRLDAKYKFYNLLIKDFEIRRIARIYFIRTRTRTYFHANKQSYYHDTYGFYGAATGEPGIPPTTGRLQEYAYPLRGSPVSFPFMTGGFLEDAESIYKKMDAWREQNKLTSFATRKICDNYADDDDDGGGLDSDPLADYDFDIDEDTMAGCKWQKDEVSYTLPELKIGSSKVGGNSISIDDGLIPLADFVCKSLELMHRGLGLHELDDTEFDKVLGDSSQGKIKPASLGELVHWQFENVSSLVGLPSAQEIVTIDNEKKDFAFRNVQDALTFLYHQQRESDMDLKIIETYNVKTAQQLEAVTQIALRQTADLEMIIQELGIKWKWERKERPSLYKHGMSDDDEKTGILELFKGGTVAYPVRIWADEVDSKQVALRTNLYAEMAAQSTLTRINSSEGIPGLDARTKMKSGDDEAWKEWVKAINIPEKGTVSGVATPYIEEYDKGTLEAKNIGAPTSALSVFMKPKKAPKK
jgi:hypothetical protein